MKLLEFVERGGAILDQMAAVQLDDVRKMRAAGTAPDLSDEQLATMVEENREELRLKIIRLMRGHGIHVHDDFAKRAAADTIGDTAGRA